MATALKSKSFQRNLLISIGGVFLLFAVCFSVYQYQREKEYKIDILHSRLQMYNYEMVQTLGEDSLTNNRLFCDYVERHNMEGLRVSIIDKNGRVILDSYEPQVDSLGNHLERTEIQQALHDGNGYDIKRLSQATISSACRNPPTRRISIQPLGLATPLYVPLFPIRQS